MSNIQKLLGLDIGEVRIGVAAGDNDVKIAYPLTVIDNNEDAISKIVRIASEESIDTLVIGLPRNAGGVETAQSAYSRAFAAKLASRGLKIAFQDESLTSVLAKTRLSSDKTSKNLPKKGEIDKEAAAIILQDYLENLSERALAPARSVSGDELQTRSVKNKKGAI
jgi:putative Holliday junction resolvase